MLDMNQQKVVFNDLIDQSRQLIRQVLRLYVEFAKKLDDFVDKIEAYEQLFPFPLSIQALEHKSLVPVGSNYYRIAKKILEMRNKEIHRGLAELYSPNLPPKIEDIQHQIFYMADLKQQKFYSQITESSTPEQIQEINRKAQDFEMDVRMLYDIASIQVANEKKYPIDVQFPATAGGKNFFFFKRAIINASGTGADPNGDYKAFLRGFKKHGYITDEEI